MAAQVMRQVLVQFARRRTAQKRGGGRQAGLDEAMAVTVQQSDEFLVVHEALDRLAAQDGRRARAIEMQYFGGMEQEEIAEILAVSVRTVRRDLELAEAWLRREMAARKKI